jgi:hypothetical protein
MIEASIRFGTSTNSAGPPARRSAWPAVLDASIEVRSTVVDATFTVILVLFPVFLASHPPPAQPLPLSHRSTLRGNFGSVSPPAAKQLSLGIKDPADAFAIVKTAEARCLPADQIRLQPFRFGLRVYGDSATATMNDDTVRRLGLCDFSFRAADSQNPPAQEKKERSSATLSAEASASVVGTVQDSGGTAVSAAEVILTEIGNAQGTSVLTAPDGRFTFSELLPGSYHIAVNAKGFERYTSAKFTLSTGQAYQMPKIRLSIAVQKQVVVVRPTEVIAQMQMRAEEKQRLIGVFPNFYTSYVWNAAPLNTRQKISLAARDIFDPVSLTGVGAAAGIEQANNSFAGYGQGAGGYGKRFAAAFGDNLISGFVSHAVLPSIFHQDPRYLYQGSGSVKSRLLHALSYAVIVRSDSGHPMPNYSDLLGDLTAGALSNLYYPRANRGARLVLTSFGINFGERAGEAVLREFLSKRFTKNVPGNGKPSSNAGDP